MRIHITGASGSGCTTLAEALARHLGFRHLDSDTYYWLPTSPPFQLKRPSAERLDRLASDMRSSTDVVLSGSIVGWGPPVEDAFDFIVFLYLPAHIRVSRLRQRELDKYGQVDEAFLEWAGLYDQGPPEGRSYAKHNAWLALRHCPVLRLERDESVQARLGQILPAIAKLSSRCSPNGAD